MDGIRRGKVPFPDGEDRRVYVDTRTRQMGLSVSEINEFRDDPEKDAAIEGWKEHYDGQYDYSSPHWKEQGLYKRKRGTLAHYVVLGQLADLDKTDEEEEAETVLKEWAERRPATTDDDIPSPKDAHAYDGAQPWSQCMREINWAVNQFEDVATEYDISPETTHSVERYVVNSNPLYGGQFDLLYEPSNGPTTLCDLKFSSGIRYGNKLQLAAYRNALLADDRFPNDIPRVQVIRLYPDDEEVEAVAKHIDGTTEAYVGGNCDDAVAFDESLDTLTSEFCELAVTANRTSLDALTVDDVLKELNDEQTADSSN